MEEANLRAYIGVVAASAVTLTAAWIYSYGVTVESRFVVGAAIFAVLLLLADRYPIRVSTRSEISAVEVSFIASVVMLGPSWAAISAVPYAVVGGRKDWLRTIYETSCVAVEAHLAAIVFSFASGPLIAGTSEPTASVVYAALASGATLLLVNNALNVGLLRIKYKQSLQEIWEEFLGPYFFAHIVSIVTAGMGVLALLVYGPVAALVVVTGSIASQALVYRSREQVQENRELRQRVRSLEESLTISNTTFGIMMIRDLGSKDGYTDRHAAATATYAADLARELKLDEVSAGRLRMAGLLHNIGMFGLPEDLLTETGRLNSIAQSRIAEHAARGEKVMAEVPEFREMASWVRWHHERPDGRGYPDKLRGPWIPLEAKILAVAQAYAGMVIDGPRHPGVSPAKARDQLCAGIDTEFDGMVVRAFLRIMDTESEGYRMADDHRFVFPAPGIAERPGSSLLDSGT